MPRKLHPGWMTIHIFHSPMERKVFTAAVVVVIVMLFVAAFQPPEGDLSSEGGGSGVDEAPDAATTVESSGRKRSDLDGWLVPEGQVPQGHAGLIVAHAGPDFGAKCLDGSAPAFYFRRHPHRNNSTWQLHFFGGAWCTSPEDCLERSRTRLGSSQMPPNTWPLRGMFSPKEDVSKGMGDANIVFFWYCDGGSFAGQRMGHLDVQGSRLYLRGRAIVSFLLQRLLDSYGLDQAKKVLISGCSAGGLAVLLNCDFMHSRITAHFEQQQPPLPSPEVKCLADAGIFPELLDIDRQPRSKAIFGAAFDLHEVKKSAPEACLAQRPESDAYQCFYAEHLLKYVQTPIFVVNSLYDSWSLGNLLGPRSADPTEEKIRRCIRNPQECSPDQSKRVHEFPDRVISATGNIMAVHLKQANGAFLFTCRFHCTSEYDESWANMVIDGIALPDAVHDWWKGSDGNHFRQDCLYPCKSCPDDLVPST